MEQRYRTYQPIVFAAVVVLVLTGVRTIYSAHADHMIMPTHIMDSFMGFFFVIYALPKFVNLPAFAESFSKYDLVAQRFSSYGYVYPLIELVLGLLYLFGGLHSHTQTIVLNGVVAAFCMINAIGVARALRAKKAAHCACLGSTFSVPLSRVTLAENVVMLAMAIAMILTYNSVM